MQNIWLGFLFTVSISLLSSETALAQKDKVRPPATVDPSNVDEEFIYQGEYMGDLATEVGSLSTARYGLQVIARGAGYFEAALLAGGLPGDGWDQSERTKIQGVLDEGVVKFDGEEMKINVARNTAVFTSKTGEVLGTLAKYDRRSATLGKQPPRNAVVLFDGEKNDHWKNMKVTEDGLLQEGCETVDMFQDFTLHIEFRLPYKPLGVGQDRGNSGVYLQRRYEVQVLDSFGEEEVFNYCGAIYRIKEPDQNMSLPPLNWQTYDIDFRAAKFNEEGEKTENMKITVRHNGIVIHDATEIESKTGAGKPEGPEPLSILLQDHGNPVRYRNIWIVKEDPFSRSAEEPVHEQFVPYAYGPGPAPVYRRGPFAWGFTPGYRSQWSYWPYHVNYRFAPLGPPPATHMWPPIDLPPYPYGW